jgi:hypothetical protein
MVEQEVNTTVTLTDVQRTAFTAAAAEGESVDDVVQARIDQQALIERTDQANAWWNRNTLDEKEALVAENQ